MEEQTQAKVPGEGSLQSKLWIIGEAPGATEEQKGKPFSGGSGSILDSILAEVGIPRSECYLDNLLQHRTPGDNFSRYYNGKVPTQELEDAHRRIKELLRKYKPNVVALLGNEPLFALTGKKGINDWRGSILEFEGIKCIPTINPTIIMRQYDLRPQSVFDWYRIKEEALTPKFPILPQENYHINPTFEDCMDILKSLKTQKHISFDIETSKNQITCIGFAWSASDAICIPIFYGNKSWWNSEEELFLIKAIKELLEHPFPKFIGQNVQFDWTFLQDLWGVNVHKMNLYMDTMVAQHAIYPELPKSLAFLTSIYTKRSYHKDVAFEGGDADALWYYNCKDTTCTWECAFEIEKECREFGTWDFYLKYAHPLIRPLFAMQTRGVLIDVERRAELDKTLSEELISHQSKLSELAGHPLNANSPKQMKSFLYDECKFPRQINKEGKLTTNEDAIKEIKKRVSNTTHLTILDTVLEIRGVRKLLSTYIRAPLDKDNRIRCNYSLTGTETGRLSSRESVYGTGTNLQNIPRGEIIRSIFIADPGKILVNADLSQAEARIVAYLSDEERLQHIFEEGGDIHRKNASRIFKKREEDITEQERDLAKAIVHASNYKIGKNRFAQITGLKPDRSQELLNQYYALFPNIKNWHRDTENQLRKSRILQTPLGRKRMFFRRWDDELIRSAIAYIPQSTVGDLLNYAIIRMFYAGMPDGWEMLLQNHDAVLFQVPEATDSMQIYKYVHHYMEIPLVINRKQFIIPADIKVGRNWANMKKLVL